MFTKYDGAWKKQDLKMAITLHEYGFTHLYRVADQKLLASFDNGLFCYEIPWLCFMFLPTGSIETIEKIIIDAGRLANDTTGTYQ